MAFGWATILLFGRVPQRKQLLLAGVALGSILWVVTLIGVLVPDVGAWLIAFVPAPDFIAEDWIRLAMLVLAIVLPLAVGAGGLMLMDEADRPKGIGGKAVQVLRGYPYAAVLSRVILFLLVVAPIFKLRTIIKRWDDAHIPIVIKPDQYDRVASDLEAAVDGAGLELSRGRAPRVLEAPSTLLATVGGASVRRLVPDQIVMLRARTSRSPSIPPTSPSPGRSRRSPAPAPPSPIGSRRPRRTSPPARSRRRSRTPSSRCATLRIGRRPSRRSRRSTHGWRR